MRTQVYLQTFDIPDAICIVTNLLNMKKKCLYNEPADDINHKCIENKLI